MSHLRGRDTHPGLLLRMPPEEWGPAVEGMAFDTNILTASFSGANNGPVIY